MNFRALAALTACGVAAASPSRVQAADFYAGKTLTIMVGVAPGGSFDAYARLVGRHIARHIPGAPAVAVSNMPGADIVAANYVGNIAPRDGTMIAALLSSVVVSQLTETGYARFNAGQFNWIGSVASPASVLVTWRDAGVKTFEDARQKEVLIGATTGTTMEMNPTLANHIAGTRFRVIGGYLGGPDVDVAMERGEVKGRGSNAWTTYVTQHLDWVAEKKIIPIFQSGLERESTIPDVPTLLEFAKTDEARRMVSIFATTDIMGRSLAAPPGVPAERVEILRKAFNETLLDKDFLADAEKSKLIIQPVEGVKLQSIVEKVVDSPADIVVKYKKAVTRPQ